VQQHFYIAMLAAYHTGEQVLGRQAGVGKQVLLRQGVCGRARVLATATIWWN
jgi:hypothetical protein